MQLLSSPRLTCFTVFFQIAKKKVAVHTWYLSFFLYRHHFLDKFFSTQKRVNRDKKFSTKQRKSPKSWFYNSLMRQNTINCTHNFSKLQIFFRFLMWRAFSTWQSVTWRIFPHDNLSCGEFFHMTTCYVEKFLHIADFFSTGTARGARDKYQVWRKIKPGSILCAQLSNSLALKVRFNGYKKSLNLTIQFRQSWFFKVTGGFQQKCISSNHTEILFLSSVWEKPLNKLKF